MRASLIWVRVGVLFTCVACSGGNASAPPVFGGEGAVIAGPAKETPLKPESASSEASSTSSADPCAMPSPKADFALLDDFEDGDAKLFKAYQREGWWFSATDNTEGSQISPLKFAGEKLSEAEATKDNAFAAHLTASGQKDWGVVWGTTLRWESNGIRCPLNASAFAGIRFRAKGPATVRVAFGIPETEPADGAGGSCKSRCFDTHGKIVHLGNCWDEYLVRWDQLQQGGWGNEARFDPARLLQLAFAVTPNELPADLWVDDIALVTQQEADAMGAKPIVSLALANAQCKGSSVDPAAAKSKTSRAPAKSATPPAGSSKPTTSEARPR
jgi:hypothetical protein